MRCLIILFGVLTLFFSCKKKYSREEIEILITSDNQSDLVKGFLIIAEQKDSSFVEKVLYDPYDSRTTFRGGSYGATVYQSKMIAMKKISGINPPKEITWEPDSVVVNFYIQWYEENKPHW